MNQEMQPQRAKPVLVTTAHRGVFFGYVAEDADLTQKTIRLERARMCVYWATDMHGVLGLATTGPSSGCRIGPAVSALTLMDITSVSEVTAAARDAWEKAPWAP